MTQFSKKRGIQFFGENFLRAILEGGPKSRVLTISPKNWTPRFFENCVIPDQYYERDLRPEVYTTSGRGCFAMAQTYRHNHGHGDSMTNSAQWGRVGEKKKRKIMGYPFVEVFIFYRLVYSLLHYIFKKFVHIICIIVRVGFV